MLFLTIKMVCSTIMIHVGVMITTRNDYTLTSKQQTHTGGDGLYGLVTHTVMMVCTNNNMNNLIAARTGR